MGICETKLKLKIVEELKEVKCVRGDVNKL